MEIPCVKIVMNGGEKKMDHENFITLEIKKQKELMDSFDNEKAKEVIRRFIKRLEQIKEENGY